LKTEEKISKDEQSKKINKSLKIVDEGEAKLINLIREEEQVFKVKMIENLNMLKNSNRLCINSFKLFTDGGNFSSDEVAVYKKMIDVEIKKVEAFAAEFQREFSRRRKLRPQRGLRLPQHRGAVTQSCGSKRGQLVQIKHCNTEAR